MATVYYAMPFQKKASKRLGDEWHSYYEEDQDHAWKRHPSTCLSAWQELRYSVSQLSPKDQSIILNSAIDKLYEDLSLLIRKRNPTSEDPELEKRIASLFQCIKTLQKQEGDLVEEVLKSHLSGPIARGWATLKNAEEFMEDYENSSSSHTSS